MNDPNEKYEILQKWHCYVQKVFNDSFFAIAKDIKNIHDDLEVEFEIKEISNCDKELIKPGAVLYWTIFYKDSSSGQRTCESEIKFPRLPIRTSEFIAKSKIWAEALDKEIGWTANPSSKL